MFNNCYGYFQNFCNERKFRFVVSKKNGVIPIVFCVKDCLALFYHFNILRHYQTYVEDIQINRD